MSFDAVGEVARGVTFLDRNFPGWEPKLTGLVSVIADDSPCVLDRVSPTGRWEDVSEMVYAESEVAFLYKYGFSAFDDDHDAAVVAEWLRVVDERLGKESA